MPGTVISTATRIWELNVHWTMYSQCGVWDPKGKGVDIWECIRDHDSTPGTQRELTPKRATARSVPVRIKLIRALPWDHIALPIDD
ncbi:hypothetical protein CC2G_013660 [Coprinopsis cinerea AmutBmut pab1-1]|nr:hypothetical protein CC2G_013660 [Coprinopsis cinerea AmutBmut pab1-1]